MDWGKLVTTVTEIAAPLVGSLVDLAASAIRGDSPEQIAAASAAFEDAMKETRLRVLNAASEQAKRNKDIDDKIAAKFGVENDPTKPEGTE